MTRKNDADLQGMMHVGRLVGESLRHLEGCVRPGITTASMTPSAAATRSNSLYSTSALAAGGSRFVSASAGVNIAAATSVAKMSTRIIVAQICEGPSTFHSLRSDIPK